MAKQIAIYTRVSTAEQNGGAQSQEAALRKYCVERGWLTPKMYCDVISGGIDERPALDKLKEDITAQKIESVVVWKLDRLSRSTLMGLTLLCEWLKKDVRVISATQNLDFYGPIGKILSALLFALAEMERDNIRENVKRGLANARAKGVKLGGAKKGHRWKALTEDQRAVIATMMRDGYKAADIAHSFHISRQSVYEIARRKGVNIQALREKGKQTNE